MSRRIAFLLFFLSSTFLLSGDGYRRGSEALQSPPTPVPASVPALSLRCTENDALAFALTDLRTLDRESQLFVRYVWIPSAEKEDAQALVFALNLLSRASVILRPAIVGNGRVMLARIDLRAYWPRVQDLADATSTWEELRFAPRFNLLLTKDTLRFAAGLGVVVPVFQTPARTKRKTKKVVKVAEDCPRYLASDGKYYDWKEVEKEIEVEEEVPDGAPGSVFPRSLQEVSSSVEGGAGRTEDVVRVVAEHLDKRTVAELVQATRSQAPVIDLPYFLRRSLSAIQDKGTAKTIYRGLYYEFVGIKRGFKKGTDEDNFLEALGVGNVAAGITAAKIFDRLRSDQRVAVFRSGVTGKPRRVDVLRSLSSRESQNIVGVTHDLKDEDIDVGTHPVMNLLDFKDAAREVIFERANGLHGFALFNGQGALQDEAPFDVALDRTIPAPHSERLQPAIGCVRCHGPEGGWRRLSNDVKLLLDRKKSGLDVFGDLSQVSKSQVDVLDRLAGLYAGDLELKILPRGRDDYANAVLRATGAWKGSQNQVDAAQLASKRVGTVYNKYVYDLVGAREVLEDLGIACENDKEVEKLRQVLLPSGVVHGLTVLEDARIAALLAGLKVGRPDYDLVFSFLAARAKH